MSIVKMKHLRAVGLRSERKTLFGELRKLGCVEISQPRGIPEDWDFLQAPDPSALSAVSAQAQELESALAIVQKHAPGKGRGLLTPRPQVSEADFFDEGAYAAALEVAHTLMSAQQTLTGAQAQLSKLETQRAALAPWLELPVDLSMTGTRETRAAFCSVVKSAPAENVAAALDRRTELYTLHWCGEDKEFRYFFLLYHAAAREEVSAALTEAGCTRMNLRAFSGTAAENDAALQKEMAAVQQTIDDALGEITAAAEHRPALERALDRALQDAEMERAQLRLLDMDVSFVLEGWFPAERNDAVTALLERCQVAYEITDPTPEEYPQVPIQLKNNPVTASMNTITEMYSMPAYDGVDPNPLMAPFFILFFGFMMNDMAYGLIMVLACALYIKLARPKPERRNFMMLFLLCGISTFFWGALTGGFLGDFIPKLGGLLGKEWSLPHLFTPMDDTVAVMVGSLVLGAIQVFTGMAISAVYKIRHGAPFDAIFDEISWWIILGAGAWAILGGGKVALAILIIGGLMLLVGGTRKAKGFGKVTSAVGIIYNGVSGFFSDILSYVRLMALMLAGSVIASVFNTLGATLGSVVPFVIVSLIGNTLNLVLNLLGCYVHTLRLQCLEFFGRFYKEGGKPFKPLRTDPDHVEIIKEEK